MGRTHLGCPQPSHSDYAAADDRRKPRLRCVRPQVEKTISGIATQFLYDGLNSVQELNGRHNPAVIANLLTGLGIDEYFTRTDTATSTFLADALGSTVGLVGSGGAIATSYTYQPFGATTVGGSANGNSYQFTGRENDGIMIRFSADGWGFRLRGSRNSNAPG